MIGTGGLGFPCNGLLHGTSNPGESAERPAAPTQEIFRATLRAIERVKTRISVHLEGFQDLLKAAQKTLQPFELQGFKSGTPEGTRTPNLLIRSQTLYPIELRVPCAVRGAERSRFFRRLSRNSAG